MDAHHQGPEVPQGEVDERARGVPEPSGPGAGAAGAPAVGRDATGDELSPWYGDLVEDEVAADGASDDELPPDDETSCGCVDDVPVRPVVDRSRGTRLVKPEWEEPRPFTPEQRVLILDIWIRSGLPAGDFAPLVHVSKHTLYSWKKRFETEGPAGLVDKPRGSVKGSRLPEATKRAILLLKDGNPDFGVQRISDMLLRGPALAASPGAVARVLHEAGYVTQDIPTVTHEPKVTRFERDHPNDLWQTDIFTFVLKRTNRRVHLVAFMDDHSRFITSFGLHATASSAMVIEAFERGIASYRPPVEVLTDNGPQYVTWRGKSAFAKVCERRGIKQIVARPRHPQTLGKIERFWGSLWRECLKEAVFADINEAERRIGLFIDYVNFQRPHQGIDGLAPADRYFEAQREVLETLRSRVAANALEVARNGAPKTPFYITGNVGGKSFSVHAAGERILMHREGEPEPCEIDLTAPAETLPVAELVECVAEGELPGDDALPAVDGGADGVSGDEPCDAGATEEGDTTSPPSVANEVRRILASLKSED